MCVCARVCLQMCIYLPNPSLSYSFHTCIHTYIILCMYRYSVPEVEGRGEEGAHPLTSQCDNVEESLCVHVWCRREGEGGPSLDCVRAGSRQRGLGTSVLYSVSEDEGWGGRGEGGGEGREFIMGRGESSLMGRGRGGDGRGEEGWGGKRVHYGEGREFVDG